VKYLSTTYISIMRLSFTLILLLLIWACGHKDTSIAVSSASNDAILHLTDDMDAVAAAPKSHEVLLENDDVRVLRVRITPGEKEPLHHHKWKSVMYVEQAARIKYYNDQDELTHTSPEGQRPQGNPHPNWMEPEGIHAVENIDTMDFIALRVELKK